jgi:G3E family GTPase
MITPVILITGFLGSGKTSFINHLIEQNSDKKISLILNEFGDIKLESQFIQAKGIGMVSELSGGCLCCVASVDLPRVIRYTLEHAPATKHLIIEASGLSDPDPVRQTLTSSALSEVIRLDTVVAIVDADNFENSAKDHPLVMSQVAEADLAIISKVESHGESEIAKLKDQVSHIGTGTTTLIWDENLDTSLVFDPPLTVHIPSAHHHHLHSKYDEYWYLSSSPHDLAKVVQCIRELPPSILRVKGYLENKEVRYLVQRVGQHVDVRNAEKIPTDHGTAILILGTELDKAELAQKFASCMI